MRACDDLPISDHKPDPDGHSRPFPEYGNNEPFPRISRHTTTSGSTILRRYRILSPWFEKQLCRVIVISPERNQIMELLMLSDCPSWCLQPITELRRTERPSRVTLT